MDADRDIIEYSGLTRDASGQTRLLAHYASGLAAVRTIKAVSLEAQIVRADGTLEPRKLLACSTDNPATNMRLRQEGVGAVRIEERQ